MSMMTEENRVIDPKRSERQLTYLLVIIVAFAPLVSCVSGEYRFAKLEEVRHSASPDVSNFNSYLQTGGIWVEGQPLLVNQEFNFAMAMSMESVGPAIAAGLRISNNRALAERLASMPPLDLNTRLEKALEKQDFAGLGYRIQVYGMVYGQPEARVYTFVELLSGEAGQAEPPYRYTFISRKRPLEEKTGWMHEDATALHTSFDESLATLSSVISSYYPKHLQKGSDTARPVEVRMDGWTFSGSILEQDEKLTVMGLADIPRTLVVYPSNSDNSTGLDTYNSAQKSSGR